MQFNPDRDMKFILVYQDYLTKFVLQSLHSQKSNEVAYHLLDIFTTFGVPNILHSDNGREFCNQIIKSLCEMWNDIKIIHGNRYTVNRKVQSSRQTKTLRTCWQHGWKQTTQQSGRRGCALYKQ
jgi:hypothetical protein